MLAQGPVPAVPLEKDFTTNGTQGNLRCPFSKPNKMQSGSEARSGTNSAPKVQIEGACGHEHLDPIKAELDERRSSHALSAPSSKGACPVSRCPIRFLDQHSPEEIAEYVERHKHEIPRSHAICVKRYQKNPQDMRQLDAKYGGLTSMISGLGVKHQAFLPECQNGEGKSSSSASTRRVEKWAEDVDLTTPAAQPHQDTSNEDDNDENRQSHFDRPLREVRVGESPSRPWGISVPVTDLPPASAPLNGSASGPISPNLQTDSSNKPHIPTASPKPAGCPFGHDKTKPESPTPEFLKPEKDSLKDLPKEGKLSAQRGCPFGHDNKVEGPKVECDESNKQGIQDRDAERAPPIPPPAPISENPNTNPAISTLSHPSSVTFNGPVFFGYSPEQTASLMQQLASLTNLNLGDMSK